MTTIAYRDGVMAADSQKSGDGIKLFGARKIVRNPSGDLCGACGMAPSVSAFLTWFESGETGPAPKLSGNAQNGDHALIVRMDGSVEVHSKMGFYRDQGGYFAMGSGEPFALGAMAVGAGAEDAVRAAVEHDLYSGGEIIVLQLGRPS